MPEPENTREAFARGQASGKTDARLDGHDDHFQRINGSIERLAAGAERQADGIEKLILVVQRLSDKFDAAEVTKVTTASALEKAEVARRDKDTQAWSPLARWGTAVTIAGAVVGAVLWLVTR